MLVRRPLKQTFAFFENAANLGRITPAWLNFRIVSADVAMRQGAEFDYVIRWFGMPMKWRSLIAKYAPPFVFVDEQMVGPYKSWHHEHTFSETPNGVIVSDNLEYELPFGPLGDVAHSLLVKHQLKAIFRYRQKALGEIFNGETQQLVLPSVD